MKNTTILLVILLIVSVALYNKKKENMIGDSAKKNELIKEIERKIQSSDDDFKVFNDEMDHKPKKVEEKIRYGMGNSIKDPTIEYFPNLLTMLKRDASIR